MPLERFNISNGYRRNTCKPCTYQAARPRKIANREQNNRNQNARRYGLTVERYDEIKAQGVCAICSTTTPGAHGFHIDHDHGKGHVRGLLCHNCNVGLGHFRDSPELMLAAIDYLAVAA